MKTESTVTIPLKEYEELKLLKENYLDKCYELANEIHKDWAKSELYFKALELKKQSVLTEEEQFLKRQIEHWKDLYWKLNKKVKAHNKKFYTFNKIDL